LAAGGINAMCLRSCGDFAVGIRATTHAGLSSSADTQSAGINGHTVRWNGARELLLNRDLVDSMGEL